MKNYIQGLMLMLMSALCLTACNDDDPNDYPNYPIAIDVVGQNQLPEGLTLITDEADMIRYGVYTDPAEINWAESELLVAKGTSPAAVKDVKASWRVITQGIHCMVVNVEMTSTGGGEQWQTGLLLPQGLNDQMRLEVTYTVVDE